MKRVVVIGAGIAGLTAAHELATRFTDVDVLVLEAELAPGGTARSEAVDGIVFDHGANGFLDSEPETLALIDRVGLSGSVIQATAAAKRRYLYIDGALCPLPSSPVALFRSPLFTFGGALRALAEPFISTRATEEESVHTFLERRFGRELADRLAQPFVTGIAAGDAHATSMEALSPRVARAEREAGSVIRGMMRLGKERRASGRTSPTTLTTLQGGLGVLTATIAAQLGERVRYGARVASVVRDEARNWILTTDAGDSYVADEVVFATPAHVAARLLRQPLPSAGMLLSEFSAVSSRVLTFTFPRAALPQVAGGFGFLSTPGCGLRLKGCIYVDSVFPQHGRDDLVVLRCIIGGFDDEEIVEMCDQDAEALILADLHRVFGELPNPVHTWHRRWPKQIPQYPVGHAAAVAAVEEALTGTHISVTGNSFRGISFNECIVDGLRTAREIAARQALTAR